MVAFLTGKPGWSSAPPPPPAISSHVFNGAANMSWTAPDAGSSSACTFSVWVKFGSTSNQMSFLSGMLAGIFSRYDARYTGTSDNLQLTDAFGSTFNEVVPGGAVDNGNWHHVVFRMNGAEATAANRIRIYLDNTLLTPSTESAISVLNYLTASGTVQVIGSQNTTLTQAFTGKMAFMELVDAASLDPSSFAFSDGGVWTRKPYTGSYGTNGWLMDGFGGAGVDASGGGNDFLNNGCTLDDADLPPYTT